MAIFVDKIEVWGFPKKLKKGEVIILKSPRFYSQDSIKIYIEDLRFLVIKFYKSHSQKMSVLALFGQFRDFKNVRLIADNLTYAPWPISQYFITNNSLFLIISAIGRGRWWIRRGKCIWRRRRSWASGQRWRISRRQGRRSWNRIHRAQGRVIVYEELKSLLYIILLP